ncbi:hypothetical protein EHM69_07835 [candidate division KSB1 bacterium]|nr:MAG: hypothetical protein EHM69_07835 [candidate division KSB1 bacterium]
MRYFPFILITVVLIALDWAALHDIAKSEPDLWAEWITIAASGLIFGVMLGIIMRSKRKIRNT